MNDVEARLRGSFARQTMMQTLGAELEEAAEGRTRISAPIAPHVLQQQGFAHAALAFAIGDSAAGYAALSVLPDGAEVVTVEMKINLLSPATGDRLVAEGRLGPKTGRGFWEWTEESAARERARYERVLADVGVSPEVAAHLRSAAAEVEAQR